MSKDFMKAVLDQFDDDIDVGKDDNIPYWVDTGNYALNRIISGDYLKGYPGGKIVEIFGDPSAGKSFLIMQAIGNFQKQFGADAACVMDDTEDSFMASVAEMNGVNPDRVIRLSSETVEGHFKSVFLGTKAKKKKDDDDDGEEKKKDKPGMLPFILEANPNAKIILALDSVASLSTEHEKEVGFEKDDMTRAKKIRAGIRMNWDFVSGNGVLYLIANHVIATMNAYGETKTTPGGKMISFMSTVRIELTIRHKVKNASDAITGVQTEAFIKKNKVGPPFRKTQIKIDFEKGIDRMSGVADLLLDDGYLYKKAGGYLYLNKDNKIRESELTEAMFLDLLQKAKETGEVTK